MASVNPLSRELVFKIVYYGPGLGGKTTTLEYLHATAKPEYRGKLVSLATPVDRTLYFDFLPVRLPPVRGMNVRLQLFTVPGQVYFNATRKLVLTGTDGIVFVSDSQIVRADANLESLENLRDNLAEQGRELKQIPLIFQHNKRDLHDVLPLEELDEMLNPMRALSLPTSARTGLGIYEGLEEISSLILRAFETRLPDAVGGGFGASFDAIEGGLVTALRDISPPASAQFDAVVSRAAPHNATWSSMPPDATLGDPSSSESVPKVDADQDGVDASPLSTGVGRIVPLNFEDTPSLRLGAFRPDPTTDAAPQSVRFSALQAATRRDEPLHAVRSGVSFLALWPTNEHELVAAVEAAISAHQYATAVERCDVLVSRLLTRMAELFRVAQASRDPSFLPLMLGLDGRRYLGFRSAVLKARAGGEITAHDALAAFSFAINARLAETSL